MPLPPGPLAASPGGTPCLSPATPAFCHVSFPRGTLLRSAARRACAGPAVRGRVSPEGRSARPSRLIPEAAAAAVAAEGEGRGRRPGGPPWLGFSLPVLQSRGPRPAAADTRRVSRHAPPGGSAGRRRAPPATWQRTPPETCDGETHFPWLPFPWLVLHNCCENPTQRCQSSV